MCAGWSLSLEREHASWVFNHAICKSFSSFKRLHRLVSIPYCRHCSTTKLFKHHDHSLSQGSVGIQPLANCHTTDIPQGCKLKSCIKQISTHWILHVVLSSEGPEAPLNMPVVGVSYLSPMRGLYSRLLNHLIGCWCRWTELVLKMKRFFSEAIHLLRWFIHHHLGQD